MKIVRNEEFLKKRSKLTQYGSLLGMGLLIVSLFLTARNPLLSWALLLAGFVIAMTAVRVGNRYVRPPRPDLVLDKVLKGLDNKYTLFHYVLPAEHVLVTPSGMIAILLREQRGRISVRGGRWRHGPFLQRLRFLLGELGLGNPSRDLRSEINNTLKAMPDLQDPERPIPLDGVIVFYQDNVQLQVENPEYPVLRADELKARVRALAEARPNLGTALRKELVAALMGEETAEESPA